MVNDEAEHEDTDGQERPENLESEEDVSYERRLNLDPFLREFGKWCDRTHRVSNFKLYIAAIIGIMVYPLSAYAGIFYGLYQFVAAYKRCDKDELWYKVRVEEVEE